MDDYECPFCNTEFEIKEWESGECPNCKEGYYWDEIYTEDYSDSWSCIYWDKWSI